VAPVIEGFELARRRGQGDDRRCWSRQQD